MATQVKKAASREGEAPELSAFTQTAAALAPANPNNLMSVRPNSEVAKRVIVPITASDVTREYQPVYTWNGGVPGDDQILAKTNVLVDDQGRGDYEPRNQDDKAKLPGASPPNAVANEPDFTIVVDVTRPRGSIDPGEPYPVAGDPAEPAPTLTSLAPNTIATTAPGPVAVVLTGTNFTQWSKVLFNGIDMPNVTPVSATKLVVLIYPSKYTAGAKPVSVWDHSVGTAPLNFTFT